MLIIILLCILGIPATAVTALAVAIGVAHRRAERERTAATIRDVQRRVSGFLARFGPGSRLVFHANGREGFLQLAVTAREHDWRRVQFSLPDTAWSHENFAVAALTLSNGAAECLVEENPGAHLPRVLRITLEGDADEVAQRAAELLRRAEQVLEFPAGQTYTTALRGPEHPDYYRRLAQQAERMPGPRWFVGRVSASLRRQAEQLERATELR
ncbi:MAG TPA: hypothetical protein VF092_28315 [Longimicrobium sp.]